MDVMNNRRRNLRLLAAQWGGPSGLAKKLHLSGPSYISQLTGGQRPFTEKATRQFVVRVALALAVLEVVIALVSR